MKSFCDKYIDREMIGHLKRSGFRIGNISNYRLQKNVPRPKQLLHICFVISVWRDVDINTLILEALESIL